jgi:hypothetical protein
MILGKSVMAGTRSRGNLMFLLYGDRIPHVTLGVLFFDFQDVRLKVSDILSNGEYVCW